VRLWTTDNVVAEFVLVLSHATWLVNDLQYLNLLVILKERLVAVNEKLRSVCINGSYNVGKFKLSTQPVNGRISGNVSQPEFGIHSDFARQSVQRSVTSRASFGHNMSEIASQILIFRQHYNALYEVCDLINSMHGCTILFNWSVHTVSFIVDLYFVSVSCIFPSASGRILSCTMVNVPPVLWNVLILIRVSVIAASCQRASDEHQRCLSNVQELQLEYYTEEDTVIQLESFSDQLVNNKIEFTACGIFPMNLSVLRSVAGLVIQYLIVLFQMRESPQH
jgi:hypothetical protein